MRRQVSFILVSVFAIFAPLLLALSGCGEKPYDRWSIPVNPKDTAASQLGERLFRETRFSQHFQTQSRGVTNLKVAGDPILRSLPTQRGDLSSPFSRQSMSCVACHMVDDAVKISVAGNRAYADFTERSRIPIRDDGKSTTPRNSPTLVGASMEREGGISLHYDGEFSTIEDLVIGGYTGRNFGWYPYEKDEALAAIVKVIREDNGQDELAARFGALSYREAFASIESKTPRQLWLPEDLKMEVASASDEEIIAQVAKYVKIYMQSLEFSKDLEGNYNGSPYDLFLHRNRLPKSPDAGESTREYAARLTQQVSHLGSPKFVDEGGFETQAQDFVFGKKELAGLKVFLKEGNCVACHAPPHFTDFKFHNTGATQEEYDLAHGQGAFVNLEIPSSVERKTKRHQYLGAASDDPGAVGQFLSPAVKGKPGFTDLGLWNVYGNTQIPKPQSLIVSLFCQGASSCDPDDILATTIARFKTPGLRDLGQTHPYLHNGRFKTIEEVVRFYVNMSELARAGALRNADPEIAKIQLNDGDILSLSAFLRSLNEDYD